MGTKSDIILLNPNGRSSFSISEYFWITCFNVYFELHQIRLFLLSNRKLTTFESFSFQFLVKSFKVERKIRIFAVVVRDTGLRYWTMIVNGLGKFNLTQFQENWRQILCIYLEWWTQQSFVKEKALSCNQVLWNKCY